MAAPQIPDKLFFRIGEVSHMVGVPPYVLRFWETEFSNLAPRKSGKGHRLYRRKDVELALEIKRLLYDRRFTIEGARKFLKNRRKEKPPAPPPAPQGDLFPLAGPPGLLADIRRELADLLVLLK